MSFNRKKNFVFYQILVAGAVFLVFLAAIAARIYPEMVLAGKSLFAKLETICGCANHFSFSNHPIIFISLMLAGTGVVLFVSFFIFKFWRLQSSTKRFVRAALANQKDEFTPKLGRVVRSLNIAEKVVEADEQFPVIFCYGFLRPKICISSGLVGELTLGELKSVLSHEAHHLFSREPLKLFVVRLISKTLFFAPGLRKLADSYLTLSELAADERATNYWSDKKHLSSALYKLLKMKEQALIRKSLAVSFLSVTEERINRLNGEKGGGKFNFFAAGFLLPLVFFLALFFSLNYAVAFGKAEIAVSHEMSGNCELMDQGELPFCHFDGPRQCALSYGPEVKHFCGY